VLYTFSTKCGKVWGKDVEDSGKTTEKMRKMKGKSGKVGNYAHSYPQNKAGLYTHIKNELLETCLY
jgi:hypothetical protein